jgi:hypothetical protein
MEKSLGAKVYAYANGIGPLKRTEKAVKALDMALHDMAKNLSDYVNVVYQKGLEKCSQEKTEIK